MTKAEQFTTAAAAVIAEYQKAVAPYLAIYEKCSAKRQAAALVAVDAHKAYTEAEEAAREARRGKSLKSGEYGKLLDAWKAREPKLLNPMQAADHERDKLQILVNLAAVPIVRLQAIGRMKVYKAYMEVYKLTELKSSSARLNTIREQANKIAKIWQYGRLMLSGAQAYCSPYNGRDTITPTTLQEVITMNEKELADALKTEAEMLDRVDLIEQAQKQLAAFKATYEKSASALYHLMDNLETRNAFYESARSIRIDTYVKK